MRVFLSICVICLALKGIVCPPVNPQPEEKGSDQEDQDTGLHYDRYLKEVVMTLEEDPDFRKKLEEANVTEIKSGKIAMHLEKVAHHVREKLDEIKRKEVARLRMLAKERMKQMQGTDVLKYVAQYGGIQKIDESILHHVDVHNPHSFEMKDLEKLIKKATNDLDELDKERRKEFKQYEMEKEHERKEHLKTLPEEERKKEELKHDEMVKKHKDHPKLHHPGSKDQLEDVWEKEDHLEKEAFDSKTFFMKHDLDGNGLLDEEELEALFQKELDQVYDPNNPEDDMEERYEEMSRMREHVLKELDKDGDKLVSKDEFIAYTKTDEFKKDEGWNTLDEEEPYTEEELKEYEQMLMEEENRRRQQGAFDGHAQPGLVMQPPHPDNVDQMQIPQGGMHPGQMPQGGMHPGQMPQGGLHPDQMQQGGLHPDQMQQGGMHPGQGLHPDQVAMQQQLHAQQQAQFHAQQQAQMHAQQQTHEQQQAQHHAQQQAHTQQQEAQAHLQAQQAAGQQAHGDQVQHNVGQGQPVQAQQVHPGQGQPAAAQHPEIKQAPAQGQPVQENKPVV